MQFQVHNSDCVCQVISLVFSLVISTVISMVYSTVGISSIGSQGSRPLETTGSKGKSVFQMRHYGC